MVDHIKTQPALILPQKFDSCLQNIKGGNRNVLVWSILIVVLAFLLTGCSPTYEGTELDDDAPDFKLVDQNGSLTGLSDFRGKVVILTFMDTKCQDTCPLTAAHFREVYGQLDQSEAEKVVFLGVNVNIEERAASDVLETTGLWHLDEIPNWHFLTGSRKELESVWRNYGVSAEPNPDGHAIMHTPGTFLIDTNGQKRWYISTPFFNDEDLSLPLSDLLLKHIRELLSGK